MEGCNRAMVRRRAIVVCVCIDGATARRATRPAMTTSRAGPRVIFTFMVLNTTKDIETRAA